MAKRVVKKSPSMSDFSSAARQALAGEGKGGLNAIKSFVSGGIRMPLAMQYLFDVKAWPLGVIIQLTGDQGSRKSTFMFHVGSWFNDLGGATDVSLTEGKLSESLVYGTCGYPDEIIDEHGTVLPFPVQVRVSEVANQWQKDAITQIDFLNGMMDKGWTTPDGAKMPAGIYAPFLFGVDSVVAQVTEDQVKIVENEGGQERGYATHVKALSQWISVAQAKITCRPYSLLLINHCTIDKVSEWQTEIKLKAGRKLGYESSLIVFMSRTKAEAVRCVKAGYRNEAKVTYVTMKLLKSSVGDDTKVLVVPILDETEIVGPGQTRQRTTFLWGEALVDIYIKMCYSDSNDHSLKGAAKLESVRSAYRQTFAEVLGSVERMTGERYICKRYQPEPMDAETFGGYLEADPEFVRVFYEQTGIKHYDVWPSGMNYSTFISQLKERDFVDRVTNGFE